MCVKRWGRDGETYHELQKSTCWFTYHCLFDEICLTYETGNVRGYYQGHVHDSPWWSLMDWRYIATELIISLAYNDQVSLWSASRILWSIISLNVSYASLSYHRKSSPGATINISAVWDLLVHPPPCRVFRQRRPSSRSADTMDTVWYNLDDR